MNLKDFNDNDYYANLKKNNPPIKKSAFDMAKLDSFVSSIENEHDRDSCGALLDDLKHNGYVDLGTLKVTIKGLKGSSPDDILKCIKDENVKHQLGYKSLK